MDSIWKKELNLEEMNRFTKNTIVENTGIVFIEKGVSYLKASMPVDKRTRQPLGILHGGASAVLAETLGSMASYMTLEEGCDSVGLELKANHIKSAKSGYVTGVAEPVHLGKTTQIWDVKIKNEDERLVCISRLTLLILNLYLRMIFQP